MDLIQELVFLFCPQCIIFKRLEALVFKQSGVVSIKVNIECFWPVNDRLIGDRQSDTKVDKACSVAAKTTRKLIFVAHFLSEMVSLQRLTWVNQHKPKTKINFSLTLTVLTFSSIYMILYLSTHQKGRFKGMCL